MIFKFQQGGITPPYVAYQPVIVSDKRTTSTSEMAEKVATDSEKGKLSDKDLYTMLKEKLKGLPSDVEEAMFKIQQVENIAKMDFDGSLSQNLSFKYLNALKTMNNLTFSREQYDKAMENVKSNGGLNEVAINQYGQIYMTDGKNFELMTPEEAKQSGWQAVTNSDLLYMRANSANFANKDCLWSCYHQY